MKIFEVIFSLCSGGAERFVVDLSNELSRQGHDVTLVTIRDIDGSSAFSFNRQFVSPKVAICNLKLKRPGIAAWRRVGKLLDETVPDIVHMHLNVIPYFFPFAWKQDGRRCFFHTLHSVAWNTAGYPGQKYLNHFFYSSRRINPVTISPQCAESFFRYYRTNSTSQIINGRALPETTSSLTAVKKQISLLKHNSGDLVFIQVGTIYDLKNQLLSAKIFTELLHRGIHAILLLIGKVGDPEYFAELKRTMPSNVFYLGEKSNVADYLTNSDAFLMPSKYEGMPISILEAFACGCVPICSAVGGIPDIITDGETGYLAPDSSEEAIQSAVERFLAAPGLIAKARLRQHFIDHYTMKTCAKEYIKLFNQSLTKNANMQLR